MTTDTIIKHSDHTESRLATFDPSKAAQPSYEIKTVVWATHNQMCLELDDGIEYCIAGLTLYNLTQDALRMGLTEPSELVGMWLTQRGERSRVGEWVTYRLERP